VQRICVGRPILAAARFSGRSGPDYASARRLKPAAGRIARPTTVRAPPLFRATLANMKTNAVRLLDSLGVPYQLREYEIDPEALEAEAVAHKIGLPPEQVFKTLVARGDRNGVCLAVVPANMELDEKALARLTGDRRAVVVPLKQVQPLTGYIRGGVTALACKRDYPVFVDETAELFDMIAVSAGVRGTQVLLAPSDYLAAVHGTVGAIARDKQS
jgi:Cys-tRNA(Pro)/Cys-tRNA(Cys) deacylase